MDKKHISKIYHNGDTLYVKDAEARETMVSGVSYDTTNKKIVETINGVNSDVVSVSTIKSDLNLTKSDVSLNNVTNDAQVKRTEMGVASGVATLDSAGKVPASQLPSYVDDVVEYASRSAFPETGETGKIYVDIAANETYRWSGSQYVIISDSQVQANWNTTDATSKSYIQNKPTNVSSFTNDAGYLTLHQDISGKADKIATVSNVAYDGTNKKITKTINGTTSDVVTVSTIKSDLNLSKSDVGLGNVTNDAQVKRSEMGEANGVATLDEDGHLEAEQLEGDYPNSVSGNVVGEFSDSSEVSFRPTAGAVDVNSGKAGKGAKLMAVKGNTVKWNQQFDLSTVGTNNCAKTMQPDGSAYVVPDSSNTNAQLWMEGFAIATHKYYSTFKLKTETAQNFTFLICAWSGGTFSASSGANTYIENSYVFTASSSNYNIDIEQRQSDVPFYIKDAMVIDLTLIYGEGNEPTTPEQFEADYQHWFGKPLTYEDYDAGSLKPVKMTGIKTIGFNAWDEEWEVGTYSVTGQKIDGDSYVSPNTTIRSKNLIPVVSGNYYCSKELVIYFYDANGNYISGSSSYNFDGFALYANNAVFAIPSGVAFITFRGTFSYGSTYNHDICINLHHSGARDGEYEPYWTSLLNVPVTTLKGKLNGEGSSVVVFPDGMKKAGNVYDEIVRRGDKTYAIKRIGAVDLGTLMWTWDNTYSVFSSPMQTAKGVANNDGQANIICVQYKATSANNALSHTFDYSVGITDGATRVIIYNSTKSSGDIDNTGHASWLSNIMLYYELATPEEYLLDDFELPQNYDVDDYGIEEVQLGTNGCAPVLDIKYGINAGDTIKNLPHNYVSAVGEQSFTEAQKARARKNIGINNIDDVPTLNSDNLVLSKGVYDSISDLQTQIDNIDDGYGIQWTNVNTSPVRIGNMKLHRTLPIQSKMRRYIKTASGIKKFISDTDYTKYEDGTTVNYQSDGELFVVVPKYWYTASKKVVDGVNQYYLTLYNRHVAGAKESKEVHISAVEASSDDATNGTPSLYSIIKANILYNNDGSVDASNLTYAEDATSYRGGNARSNNTNDTDTGAKCMLGRPVTSLTRAAFRERAARRGTGYSQQYWTAYMAWVRLYVVEYCSFNSLASYNENKTTEGYMQGGLGAGVSAISNWGDLNGYNPVVPCGVTIRLGNKTGVVTYRTDSQTTYVPSYRGIENPFGEIWKWTDGLNQHDTEIYVCDDITKFADDTSTGYELRGNCATGGWIKDVIWDENGEFIPSAVGGSDSSYYHDYMWYAGGWRVLGSGGGAHYESADGLFYFGVSSDSSNANTTIGGRLYYTPDNN